MKALEHILRKGEIASNQQGFFFTIFKRDARI